MKRILLVVLALALSVPLFAAVTGNGTCTVAPDETINTKKIATLAWTFTQTENNMDGPGVIGLAWPSGWEDPGAARFTLAGTAAEAKKVVRGTYAGQVYYWVTATADVDATIILTANNITVTATTGAQAWTVVSSDDDATLNTENASAIAALPSTYVWNALNKVGIAAGPTPAVLNTYKDNMAITITLSTSYTAGQIQLVKNVGTPAITTTPDVPDWSGTANTNGQVRIISTPGIFSGSATINATQIVIPIGTASSGDVIEVYIGDATNTPTVGPFGGNFVKGHKIDCYANAIGTIPATCTPQAVGTWTSRVATPTLVLTPVYSNGKISLQMSGWQYSNKLLASTAWSRGGSYNSSASEYAFDPDNPGAYTLYGYITWKDNDNEGYTISNTTNAVTIYDLPDVDNLGKLINDGLVTKELYSAIITPSGGAAHVTSYALAQYIFAADLIGTTDTAVFSRVVDGATATTNVVLIPAQDLGLVGMLDSPYIQPAGIFDRWYMGTGDPTTYKFEFYRYPLTAR